MIAIFFLLPESRRKKGINAKIGFNQKLITSVFTSRSSQGRVFSTTMSCPTPCIGGVHTAKARMP